MCQLTATCTQAQAKETHTCSRQVVLATPEVNTRAFSIVSNIGMTCALPFHIPTVLSHALHAEFVY